MKIIFSKDEFAPVGAVPFIPWDDPELRRLLLSLVPAHPSSIDQIVIDERGIYVHLNQSPH